MSNPTPIAVPSGLTVTLQEVLTDRQGRGRIYRFRFVAPEIAGRDGGADFDLIGQDLAHLCSGYALPRVATDGVAADRIVISIADRPTVFGQADPDAAQYFEAYRIDGDACTPEPY